MDVGGWLRGLGLGKYEATFCENGIDKSVLPHLTVEDLKELGVARAGDRRKLLTAVADLSRRGPRTGPVAAHSARPAEDSPEVSAERRPITVMFCGLAAQRALPRGSTPKTGATW